MSRAIVLALLAFVFYGLAPSSGQKFQVPKKKAKELEQPENSQVMSVAGRSLEKWIKDIHSPDASRRENAIRSILFFGPDRAYEAVPALLDELRKHKAPPTYRQLDTSVRVNATMALGVILGTAREPKASWVKEAVAVLTRLLNEDTQQIVRYRAAQALGRIGPDAKSAKTSLLATIKDTYTWETREAAAVALGQIFFDKAGKTSPPIEVLKGLYDRLGDSTARVRVAAIQSLTSLGAQSDAKTRETLVKYLETLGTDKEHTVRIWAHMAVMNIKGKAMEKDLTAIGGLLKDPDMPVRIQAAQALGIVGPDAKSQIKALIAGLDDEEPDVVVQVMWSLARMGKSGQPALAALKKIADRPPETEPRKKAQVEVLKKTAAEAIDVIQGKQTIEKKKTPAH